MKQCLVLSLLCMVGGSALAMNEAALMQTIKNADAAAVRLHQQGLELQKQKERFEQLRAAEQAAKDEESEAFRALSEAHDSLRDECYKLREECRRLRRDNAETQKAIDELKLAQNEYSSSCDDVIGRTAVIGSAFYSIFDEFSSRLNWKGYDAFLRNFDFDSKDSRSQFLSAADLLIGNFEKLLEARILSYKCSPDQDDYSLIREVVDLCSARVRDLKDLDEEESEDISADM